MGCKYAFAFCAIVFASTAGLSATPGVAQGSSSSSTITLVQSANAEGNAVSSLSQSFSSANASGNLIVSFVRMSTTTQAVQLSDSLGNIYKEAVSQIQSDDGHQIHIFYATNISSGANTVTANFSGVNNHPWLSIFEYSGIATSNALDTTSSSQGSGAVASSGNPIQTRPGNELVFAAVGLPSSSSMTISAGSGFNIESQDANTPGSRAGIEDQVTSSSDPLVATFSLSANANWTAALATFISAQLAITTTTLPQGVVGVPYSVTVGASGGVQPYTWSVSGSLPAGLNLSTTGVISGTPTSAGNYSFAVQVADADGNNAVQPLEIQVNSQQAAPISLLQSVSAAGSGVSTLSQSFPSVNTAGNLIVAFVRMSTASQTVELSDTLGNVYKDAVSQTQSADGHQTHIFYAANIAAGANTVTATFSGVNNHPWVAIYEYSGLDPIAPLDKTAHAEGASSAANSGATQPSSSAPELIFGGVGMPASSTYTVAADAGFTMLQQNAPPDSSRAANEQAIVNTAGSYASSFTLAGFTNWTAVLATFQASAPPRGQISANPGSVNFGAISAGTNSVQAVTVSNVGNTAVNITQISASGSGFSVVGPALPYSLSTGAAISLQVTFSPELAGSYNGAVAIASDASNSSLSIPLSGTATHSVSLNWTDADSGIAGYTLYRATQSGGPYMKLNSSLISSETWLDTNVQPGATYYYVVTATGTSGVESAYSREATAAIPNP